MSGEFEDVLDGGYIAQSQDQKESTANLAFDRLASAHNLTLEVDISAGTVAISAANFGRYGIFKLTGNPGSPPAAVLTVPDKSRKFAIINATVASVTIDNGGDTASLVAAEAAHFVGIAGDGVYKLAPVASGAGDVVGPAAATDNALARYDATTGKLLQNSSVIVDDDGSMYGMGNKKVSVTGDYSITNADKGKVLVCSKSSLITLTVALTTALDDNFYCTIINRGAGPLLVAASGSDNLECDSKPYVRRAAQLMVHAQSQSGSPSGGLLGLYGDLTA